MLLRIPALLTRDEVRACRQAMEQARQQGLWQDGRATAGHLAAGVKANLQLPIDSPLAAQLGDLILDKLGASPLFMAAALPLKVLPPRFNRYEGGGTYGNHIDNGKVVRKGLLGQLTNLYGYPGRKIFNTVYKIAKRIYGCFN